MIVKSIELNNFRNYKNLKLDFDEGINIFYGNNAQGKTNLLEAVYYSTTTKSYRSCKDKELIYFGEKEAHIQTVIEKGAHEHIIDFHLKDSDKKGIAVNKIPLKRAGELYGLCKMVFFSPEDLNIIKQGPSVRRRFLDMEIAQIEPIYLNSLTNYKKLLNERNCILKDYYDRKDFKDIIDVIDIQLINYGKNIIEERNKFIRELNVVVKDISKKITDGKETLEIGYESDVTIDNYELRLEDSLEKDIKFKSTSVGPHRDDLSFKVNDIDLRHFGSQGQQRTAALCLKLAEIELLKKITRDKPVLLLDDVLSELDKKRQCCLLDSISGIQTLITCTGLEDFIKNNFNADKLYHVEKGVINIEA